MTHRDGSQLMTFYFKEENAKDARQIAIFISSRVAAG
jgi:hypothetical protein